MRVVGFFDSRNVCHLFAPMDLKQVLIHIRTDRRKLRTLSSSFDVFADRLDNARDELGEALELLRWVASRAPPSGVLAEQLDPLTAAPVSVSPLLWSHAEFVIAVCQYLDKYSHLLDQKRNRGST